MIILLSFGSLWLLGGGWNFKGHRGGREQGDQLGASYDHPGERKMVWNAVGCAPEGFTVKSGTENVHACIHTCLCTHTHSK